LNFTYSKNGLALTKQFEGCKLTAYQDSVGVWTIGYGHTGSIVNRMGVVITQAQADSLLMQDIARFEDGVNKLVKVPLNQNQFDALVDFSFNLGLGNLGSSTLLKKLNAGDIKGAAEEFLRWDKAGGKVLAGLTRRRKAERDLFLA
jgi:lysozyme